MSEQAVLWAFGILIAINGALIAVIWRSLNKRLDDIDTGALAAFIARFNATEAAWDLWRKEFTAENTKRHDAHGSEIRNNDRRITRLERNGHEPQNNRP